MRGFIPPVDDDERLFVKRIKELTDIALSSNSPRATMFLSDRQQSLAMSALSQAADEDYFFYGGYEDCERALLCIGDTLSSAKERVAAVEIAAYKPELTHRDYLGALLALGIKRECIGDIIVQGGGAIALMVQKAARLAASELGAVGKTSVHTAILQGEIHYCAQSVANEMSATVAALRLDCVLAATMNCSRSDAQALIKSKAVEINHIKTQDLHYEVQAQDVLTVRGKGKYKLSDIGGKSRKDRLFIKYYKY